MSFPILSYDEAITNCRDLANVDVAEEDLRRPTSQFVKKLYLDIITSTLDISVENLRQPHFKFLSSFRHHEIVEEGASYILFTIIVQRYMHSCMAKNFTIKDLSNPTPKRTLNFISALVNFAKFKALQDVDTYFDTPIEEKETLIEQNAQLLEKNREHEQKLEQIKVSISEEDEKLQQILPVVEDMNKVVIELNKQQINDYKEAQQLKTDAAEMNTKAADLKVLIANDKEECERLKAQIVTSPEKFSRELSRMNDAINACKDSISEKGQKLLKKKNEEESINLLEENSSQAVKLISSLEGETEKLRDLQHKVQELHDVVTADDEAFAQKNFQYKNVKRQFTSQNEKLSRLERTNEKKVSAKNDEFENRKKNVELLEKSRQPCQPEISQKNAELQEVLKTLNEREDIHAHKMDTMEDAYQQIITSVNNYHGKLEEASKRVLSTLSNDLSV